MDILTLVLLYYLSQNAEFAESVKPIMGKLKDSEEMLRFLNDLSKFTQAFTPPTGAPSDKEKPQGKEPPQNKSETPPHGEREDKKNPQSPTSGIADEFIQNLLDSYFQKRG